MMSGQNMPHSSIHVFNANKASMPDFSGMKALLFYAAIIGIISISLELAE